MSGLNFSIRLEDKKGWTRGSLELLAAEMPVAFRKAMDFSTALVLARVQDNLTGKILQRRTGRLRSSFSTDVVGQGMEIRGIVGSNLVYAPIHEFGGFIIPRRGQYLIFKIADQWVRTRRVTMPARRYLSTSMQEAEPEIIQVFSDTLHEAMMKVVRGDDTSIG